MKLLIKCRIFAFLLLLTCLLQFTFGVVATRKNHVDTHKGSESSENSVDNLDDKIDMINEDLKHFEKKIKEYKEILQNHTKLREMCDYFFKKKKSFMYKISKQRVDQSIKKHFAKENNLNIFYLLCENWKNNPKNMDDFYKLANEKINQIIQNAISKK